MAEQKIYPLIGEAMRRLTAVAKDSVNKSQGFKYRGIDAVMNALYPVMSELGLFFVPEVLEQTREERTTTKSVWDNDQKKNVEKKSTLLYSLLKIKYTLFAPDGSSVSAVVIGEGMDSGDKASNKAMAVGLKYAAFQLFMIPTEEMKNDDPDGESHDIDPKETQLEALTRERVAKENKGKAQQPATVETAPTLPNSNPVAVYLAKEKQNLQKAREITPEENSDLFTRQLAVLRKAGKAPNKALSAYTQTEAETLISNMYKMFDPLGTELKDVEGA